MSGLRRVLTTHSQPALYALAAKWLLNWIIGPLWLLAFAWGLPRGWELVQAARARRGASPARGAP
jgi:hypothetical protein